MFGCEMRSIGIHIAINFEDLDASRIVLVRYSVKDQNTRLHTNSRFNLLLYRSPVCIQMRRVDLDLRYLYVLSIRLLCDGATAECHGQHGCAENEKLLGIHPLLLTGATSLSAVMQLVAKPNRSALKKPMALKRHRPQRRRRTGTFLQ